MTPMTGSDDAGTSVAYIHANILDLAQAHVREVDTIRSDLFREQYVKDFVETVFIVNGSTGSVDQRRVHVYECGDRILIHHLTHDNRTLGGINGVHRDDSHMGSVNIARSPFVA